MRRPPRNPRLAIFARVGVPRRYNGAIALVAAFGAAQACSTTDLDVVERLAPAEGPVAGPGPGPLPTPEAPRPEPPAEPVGSAGPATEPEPASAPPEPEPTPEPVSAPEPEPEPVSEPGPVPTPVATPTPVPGPIDAGSPCDGIVPLNLYRLRVQATDECLVSGRARQIGGIDAFDAALGDCESEEAVWQIVASTLSSFEIRNVPTNFNLDVEMGVVELGTPLVLFPAHDLQNQKFVLDELDDGTVRIQPRLGQMSNLCVQASAARVALAQCAVGDTSAKWYIDADECEE